MMRHTPTVFIVASLLFLIGSAEPGGRSREGDARAAERSTPGRVGERPAPLRVSIHVLDDGLVNMAEPDRSRLINEQIARFKSDLGRFGARTDVEWRLEYESPHAVVRSDESVTDLARKAVEKSPERYHVFVARLEGMKSPAVRAAVRKEGAAEDTTIGVLIDSKVFRDGYSVLTHQLGRAAGLWPGEAKHAAKGRCTCMPEGQ